MPDDDGPQRLPPRLVSELVFPPYSYVTGQFPHPINDPAGHSFGHTASRPTAVDPRGWLASRDYLAGCDLFNHGYYWEAHELWEGLWQASGRSGTTASFLKGLIKLAAAGVKVREGRAEGVRRHAARAAELFREVRLRLPGRRYLGLDLDRLIAVAVGLAEHPPARPSGAGPVEVVFDFWILPDVVDAE